MKRTKRIAPCFAAIMLTLLVSSRSHSRDIYYGWPGQGSWTTLPFVVATETGLFEKEGVRVKMIAFRGTNLMMAALLSGEIDYGTFLPFFVGAAARGLPVKIAASMTKSAGYAMITRPEIPNVLALRGKKIGINSFGSSADFAAYTAISASGLDPNKDVTFLPIGGSTPERLAALASGAVEATVLTSPNEFNAEKQGFKTVVSMKDLTKLVRIPVTGMAVGQKKIERESDEIVRVLRALRRAILMIQEQPAYGIALFQKVLRLDGNSAKEFYGLFRDQYNPELSLPDSVVEELLAVGTFRSKEKDKTRVSPQQVRDWTLAEKALRP